MSKLSRKETKYMVENAALRKERSELRRKIMALQKRLKKKDELILLLRETTIPKAGNSVLVEGPPQGALVQIKNLWYKIGRYNRVYYHNGMQWCRSTLELREIEAAIG